MKYITLLTEFGMGVDLMGRDAVESVRRAIEDIIHRVCIPYFREAGIGFEESRLVIDVFTPYPERLHPGEIAGMLPVRPGSVEINIHKGGARIKSLDEAVVSIVAITIQVPVPGSGD